MIFEYLSTKKYQLNVLAQKSNNLNFVLLHPKFCLIVVIMMQFSIFHSIFSQTLHANNLIISKSTQSKMQVIKMLKLNNIPAISLQKDFLLLLFFDPIKTPHKVILSYAQVLQIKYSTTSFQIIAISNRPPIYSKEIIQDGKFVIPVITDQNKSLHALFGFNDCCGGTVFFNKDGEILFSDKTLSNEEVLRQIVEKALIGKINYIPQIPKDRLLFNIGSPFPRLIFRKEGEYIKSESKALIKDGYTVITFFSSICSVCNNNKRNKALIKIKNMFDNRHIKTNFYLAFFHPFNEDDVQYWEQGIPFSFEKMFCYGDIFTDDEKYISDLSMHLNPVTLIVDSHSFIVFIEPFGLSEDGLVENVKKLMEYFK